MTNVMRDSASGEEKPKKLVRHDYGPRSILPRFELYVRNINVEFPRFVTSRNETCSRMTPQSRPFDVQLLLSGSDASSDWSNGGGWGRDSKLDSVLIGAKSGENCTSDSLGKTKAFLRRLRVRKESEDTYLMFDPITGGVFIADSEMDRIVTAILCDQATPDDVGLATKVIEPFLISV
jgi:hypothetical protein